jgi:hypothetical protein
MTTGEGGGGGGGQCGRGGTDHGVVGVNDSEARSHEGWRLRSRLHVCNGNDDATGKGKARVRRERRQGQKGGADNAVNVNTKIW